MTISSTRSITGLAAVALAAALAALLVTAPPALSRRGSVSGGFSIAAGAAYTASVDVTLTSSASGTTTMRARNEGEAWSSWQPYATQMAWRLPAGEGLKTVEVQYKGASGRNLSSVDTIVLDTTSPVTTATPIPGLQRIVGLDLEASDTSSGVVATMWRLDAGEWSTEEPVFLKVRHKRRSLHTLEYYSVDLAGNAETVQRLEIVI